MMPATLYIVIVVLLTLAFYFGRQRAFAIGCRTGHIRKMHSRPIYYGSLSAIWTGVPALILMGCWLVCEPGIITGMVIF